ncbi:MAG: hypothetical protein AB7I59_07685 [Geminicoccaceae bacterium]
MRTVAAPQADVWLAAAEAQLPPAPEALGRDVRWLRERTDAPTPVQAAAGELYEQLTPQQRTAFDFLAVSASGTGSAEPY